MSNRLVEPSSADGVIVYGLFATDSPAARLAEKVIFPAPRSPARKPLLVVPSVGSTDPYTFVSATADTDADFFVIVNSAVL